MALARWRWIVALEDARTDEDSLGTELHRQGGVGGRGDTTGAEEGNRKPAGLGDLLHQRQRCLQLLGPLEELGRIGLTDLADVADDVAEVTNCLDDVAGAGLALRANQTRAFADAPQRLAQVGGTAHERNRERELVDVVSLVGRSQHFALVDVIDPERLEDLGLDEVPDACFGHDRDGDGCLDRFDHLGVAHPRHPSVSTDVGRHSLERHHRARPCVLCNFGLFSGDDIHDDATFQHLCETALDRERAGGARRGTARSHVSSVPPGRDAPQGVNGCVRGAPGTTLRAQGLGVVLSARANSTQVRPGVSRIGLPSSAVKVNGFNRSSRLQEPCTTLPPLNT